MQGNLEERLVAQERIRKRRRLVAVEGKLRGETGEADDLALPRLGEIEAIADATRVRVPEDGQGGYHLQGERRGRRVQP